MFNPNNLEFDDVSKELLAAAQRIRERGHCKNAIMDIETGAVCALGAIFDCQFDATSSLVIFKADPEDNAHRAFAAFLGLEKNGVDTIPNWNDAPERTAEDVINALEECAYARAAVMQKQET